MANLINVKSIGDVSNKSKGKAKWTEFTVTYDSDKGEKEKRFISFKPDEYKVGKSLVVGKTYETRFEKDGDFWNWVGAEEVADVGKPAAANKAVAGAAWDADRQLHIVRQSMIKAAVDLTVGLKLKEASKGDIASLADFFVEYVYKGLPKAAKVEQQEPEVE